MTTDQTTETAEVVHHDTSQLSRAEWLMLRRTGIGSSDAAAALGLSPWVSQYELWAEKSGLLAEKEDFPRFRVGRDAEPLILGWWSEMTGVELESVRRHLMLRSTEYPFMLANPDGLTDDAVIEVKTAHPMDEKRWGDGVPDQYVIQAMHLMAVTGRRQAIFPVSFGWQLPLEVIVDWDPVVADAMVTVEAEMWRRIQDREAPDPDGSESSMMTLREQFFTSVPHKTIDLAPVETLALLAEREIAVEQIAAHTKIVNRCKARLMAMLGDAEDGQVYGETVVTWRPNKDGVRSMRFPAMAS